MVLRDGWPGTREEERRNGEPLFLDSGLGKIEEIMHSVQLP